jgi:hypothetical protein
MKSHRRSNPLESRGCSRNSRQRAGRPVQASDARAGRVQNFYSPPRVFRDQNRPRIAGYFRAPAKVRVRLATGPRRGFGHFWTRKPVSDYQWSHNPACTCQGGAPASGPEVVHCTCSPTVTVASQDAGRAGGSDRDAGPGPWPGGRSMCWPHTWPCRGTLCPGVSFANTATRRPRVPGPGRRVCCPRGGHGAPRRSESLRLSDKNENQPREGRRHAPSAADAARTKRRVQSGIPCIPCAAESEPGHRPS